MAGQQQVCGKVLRNGRSSKPFTICERRTLYEVLDGRRNEKLPVPSADEHHTSLAGQPQHSWPHQPSSWMSAVQYTTSSSWEQGEQFRNSSGPVRSGSGHATAICGRTGYLPYVQNTTPQGHMHGRKL